jgi:response regulator RpfG family c-di-GMP phosphodiesterase
MSAEKLPRVLCVDDEPRVVDSLAAHLRRGYEVLTAHGGQSALSVIKEKGPPAVIISDMRMPEMDGATLLKQMKDLYPETTRILLTGEPGRDAAVSAINEGQIFRFLTKPCPPDALRSAIEAGVLQHRMVVAERVLLQETLVGCIKTLIDVLAITNTVAFGRARRIKELASELAAASGAKECWQLEAAAMLSQLGYISLPTELVEKLYYGKRLTPEERTLADGAPEVARRLLSRIPRLEPVLEILVLSRQSKGDGSDGIVKLGGQILRIVLEYDAQIARGQSIGGALLALRSESFDAKLVKTLESLVGEAVVEQQVSEVLVGRLTPGMVFLNELRTSVGTLLVPKGFEVTEAFLERVRNFGPNILQEKVRVTLRS